MGQEGFKTVPCVQRVHPSLQLLSTEQAVGKVGSSGIE